MSSPACRAAIASLIAMLFSACASKPPHADAPPAEPTKPAKVADHQPEPPAPPEFKNLTPFFGNILICDEACSARVGQDYFTWNIKLSFDIDRNGGLDLSSRQEPALTQDDDPALDSTCGAKGSTGNQRNTWFPDTAIFVRGGRLLSASDGGRKPLKLSALSAADDGAMKVIGKAARDPEWHYLPCVGSHRVKAGFRLDGFLPPEAVLSVKPEKGTQLNLSLPSPTEPYVLLRYHSGAMIPAPMRPIILTIDLVERRLVAYYQTTFAVAPPLRKIELRAVLPDQEPGEGETKARFVERTRAVLEDLHRCPVPLKPIEACATPDRHPDRRIFSF